MPADKRRVTRKTAESSDSDDNEIVVPSNKKQTQARMRSVKQQTVGKLKHLQA